MGVSSGQVCGWFSGTLYCVPATLLGTPLFRKRFAEASRHRKARRQRTRARTLLRFFLEGYSFPEEAVEIAAFRLGGHHSGSVLPSRALQELAARRVFAGEMTSTPWQCGCGSLNKYSAAFCPQCGTAWQARNTASPRRRRDTEWSGWESYTHSTHSAAPWKDSAIRPSSPRRKRGGWGVQQPKGKPKGAPKGGKSGGKGKWETQDTAPSAPQIESLPAAPSATAPPLPRKAVESSGAAPSQEKAQLDTLVSLLAEAGANVPEPVRALVAEHQRSATQNLTRSLHRAVADQSRARAELQKLRANRSLFLEAWKGYIDQLTALLEAQLNDQEAALEKFNTAEIDWLASEREATIAIARMASKDQALSEEDQEMEDGEFRASEAAETEARLQKETEEHQSAGRHLHNALQVARQQAAEHLNRHQREGSRTPRRKNDAESEGQQVDKAKEDAAGKPSGGTATTPFKLGGSQAQAKPAPEAHPQKA